MIDHVETLIVGGGQAGLSVSYHLTQQHHEHVILERAAQAAEAWRNGRWDSFTLVTPNWTLKLPGAEYDGDDPDGFMPRADVVAYFERYVERFRLPVRYGVEVTSIERHDGGYRVATQAGVYQAANVVVATGSFQQPRLPAFSESLPADIVQVHSSRYRNPGMLPDGAVLVVGAAQSGCQIAEELYLSGRKVYMSVGNAGRVPRRYRGRDIVWWLAQTGFFDRTVDKLPSLAARSMPAPQASGTRGGHNINLHQFARDGVVLLGRLQGADGRKIVVAPDLKESLAKTDKFEAELLRTIDEFIDKSSQQAPADEVPQLRDGYDADVLSELDLKAAGVTSVVWANGYRFDHSLVRLPLFDEWGYPLQKRGVTDSPGLYFVGMWWLHSLKSAMFLGVGEDAAHIASHLTSWARRIPGEK